MVLELGGQALDSLHKGGRRSRADTSGAQARKWWLHCVKCVEQVHLLDVLHCDIKPNNFLMIGERLKIIDFGCAALLGPLDEAVIRRKALGTTRFMSPEYIQQKIVGLSSPFFSFILFFYRHRRDWTCGRWAPHSFGC